MGSIDSTAWSTVWRISAGSLADLVFGQVHPMRPTPLTRYGQLSLWATANVSGRGGGVKTKTRSAVEWGKFREETVGRLKRSSEGDSYGIVPKLHQVRGTLAGDVTSAHKGPSP